MLFRPEEVYMSSKEGVGNLPPLSDRKCYMADDILWVGFQYILIFGTQQD
jgi:hypothetical protein